VVLFVCSVQYLIIKREKWDRIAAASAEAGLVFATALNVTGMIFARAEWGQWWTASPRLISSAVLWFLYVAYLILRASLTSEQQRAKISAVFGIIAFIDVPLVLISARFVRDIHQPNAGFQTGWQYAALGLAVCGMLSLAWMLIWIRADILKTDSELSNID
jgi:heme exporter protein C